MCEQIQLKEAVLILHHMGKYIDSTTYANILQGCINKKILPEGKLVHAHIIQTGSEWQDTDLANTLVTMYAKCGRIEDARNVFDKMPLRNLVTWTVMIAAYARDGYADEAWGLFYQMKRWDVQPNQFTFASLLPACFDLGDLKNIHGEIIRRGFQSNVFVGNGLVDMYAKYGRVEIAHHVFDKMPHRNIVSWTAMVSGYAQNGYVEEALKLFEEMPQCNVVSWNAMISGFVQNGQVGQARKLFQQMPQPNVVTWNALIAGYAQNGEICEALKIFQEMPERNVVSWNAMIAGYALAGLAGEALRLFETMPVKNVVSWTAMISAFAQNGHDEEALKLFQQMQLVGVRPNPKTFAVVLLACTNSTTLEQGMQVHEDIIRNGFQSNVFVTSALVDMYAKCGSIENAHVVFDKMSQRDVTLWNAMIAGYVHNGHIEEALKLFQKMSKRDVISWNTIIDGYIHDGHCEEASELFRQMQMAGVKSNAETFSIFLPACANLAALEQGKEVHEVILRSGFQFNLFVGGALVDMYAKCGSIENARTVFNEMPQRDVVSWNIMITGYALHGYGREALQLFEQMQDCGAIPDHVTFLGVLSACCHAGLVDEAWQYFYCLSHFYHIKPAMEHYSCMVDLLGRAGYLDGAHGLINRMPMKPDSAVWGSLLSACRIHTDIELGERVAEHLLELDPENDAPYVLLSNIYAAAGRRNDIEKVRKIMKDRRIKKKPGCSWIEVNKQVAGFLVSD